MSDVELPAKPDLKLSSTLKQKKKVKERSKRKKKERRPDSSCAPARSSYHIQRFQAAGRVFVCSVLLWFSRKTHRLKKIQTSSSAWHIILHHLCKTLQKYNDNGLFTQLWPSYVLSSVPSFFTVFTQNYSVKPVLMLKFIQNHCVCD